LIVVSILIGLFLTTSLPTVEILFWIFFFSLFWWRIDGRVAIACALFFLILIPILLTMSRYARWQDGEAWAEVIAIWVFYLLSISVGKQIWELSWDKDIVKEDAPPIISVPTYANVHDLIKPETSKNMIEPKRIHDIQPPTNVSRKRI